MARIWMLVVAAAMMFGANTAEASLMGSQVKVNYYFPDLAHAYATQTVTVGAGSEIACPGGSPLCVLVGDFDLDIVASSVTVRLGYMGIFNKTSFNGFSFENLDFGDGAVLSGVALDTNILGLDLSRVSFGDHFVRINLSELYFTSQSFFALNFTTSDAAAVPEPAALGLLGLGLITLGAGLRRRRGV
ncbi:PEP-CTERM sorting domain-containing protein [Govanella unica]|uniref:PEP-CTERM sorting domain-containing protein n=1 Tax=Govanella unica TaxID=2975056 RepID=A0A9X3TXQ4_9PROT|nr:PEP-CTERM sorting domain-containing protein [Govania unica]MDA5193925.1 PEP-CTERM sorting domain-containing protein [Govania unica]